jgi:hypothetical protein
MLTRDDALGILVRGLVNWESDESFLAEVMSEFRDLARKLPRELHTGDESLDLDNPQTLRQAIEDVKHLLLARLLSVEGNQ